MRSQTRQTLSLDQPLQPTMLVLFETPAGYALFKLRDDGKLDNPDELAKDFASPEGANKLCVATTVRTGPEPANCAVAIYFFKYLP